MSTDLDLRSSATLGTLDVARRALAEAETLPEIAALVDRAEVVRVAARAAGLSTEAQNDWTRYKIDCERAGAECIERLRAAGELAVQGGGPLRSAVPTLTDYLGKKSAKQRANEWAKLASLPDEEVDAEFEQANKAGKAMTEAALLKLAKKREKQQRRTDKAAAAVAALAAAPEPTDDDCRIVLCAAANFQVAPDSVDLIFTDPPYPEEFLPAWSDLGALAAKALKPGALCIAYSGQMFLPEVMRRLGEHLDYWWMGAIVHESAFFQLKVRRMQVAWKPLLIYRKPGGPPPPWSIDATSAGQREKDGHEWQQAEAEAEHWITALTKPEDLIVDPFVGSGTTPAVAKRLRRRFLGCDIDEVAVIAARERVA